MNIKNKFTMLGILTLAGLATACSNDEEQKADSRREIQLKAQIGNAAVTRAANEVIPAGTTVWMWADETLPETKEIQTEGYITAWEMKSFPGGILLPTRRQDKKHYPEENLLNFYGFAGNFSGRPVTASTTPYGELGTFVHNITADQTTTEKMEVNDLIFGEVKDVSPNDYNANVVFYHMLTQVKVALIAKGNNKIGDDQARELSSATVKLLGVKKSVRFTPLAKDADYTDAAVRLAALADDDSGTQDISIATAANAYGATYKYATAIIPPMTVNGDFVEVVFKDNTYTIQLDKNLEAGKCYMLNILFENNATFTASAVEVSSWTTNTSDRPVELVYN